MDESVGRARVDARVCVCVRQVWWCELCRVYLPAGADEAEALRKHCRLRIHLGRYVQHRDTRTLRKHAERIHRQLHQQKGEACDAALAYFLNLREK